MLVRIHSATRHIVALCDSDLIGQRILDKDGLRQIDLTGPFFRGEEKNQKEVIGIIQNMRREDASFNIVGKESCATALKAKLISPNGISIIGEIPTALTLL